MGRWLRSTSPLKNASKPGKRSGGDRAREQIIAELKGHEMEVRGGLQYVKFGDKWISIADTDEIEKIIGKK